MKYFKLSNKKVLLIKGKAAEFLKGFSTNALEAPRNAFVDLKGRIVATFEQGVLSPDEVLIAIERQFFDRLKKHLEKYLFLSGTLLEETSHNVYFDLEDTSSIVITEKDLPSVVSEEEWVLFRLKHHLPIQGIDYDDEMILNVGEEAFVSYTKGCYLGQETVAKVHYRGKPPKKLVVKSQDECTPDEIERLTSKTRDPKTGKFLGFVFVSNE